MWAAVCDRATVKAGGKGKSDKTAVVLVFFGTRDFLW
jgi:hypothetical protein